MTRPTVRLLGRTRVEVGGREVRLAPNTAAVLIRLIVAGGEAVTVNQIYRDVWEHTGRIHREQRVSVQKRILELRRGLDPGNPGEHSKVLVTERGKVTAYRLRLGRDEVDVHRFRDLVVQASGSAPTTAVELLTEALDLWQGAPLHDVADQPFARPYADRLYALRREAKRELMYAYTRIGLPDKALWIGEALSADLPGDAGLARSLTALRERMRAKGEGELFRHRLPGARACVVIAVGDLFHQDDAHLVAGFTDTFDTSTDTSTDQDMAINDDSVQGQLLRRLYDGERTTLDRELRAALRHITPAGVERRSEKRRGKLTRYPIGTVATLRRRGRCVFAVAYSRMGNDLVARSSLADLRRSLEHLWPAVYRYGRLKPVAIPLVGAGLARIHDADHEGLLQTIIESFVAESRARLCTPELRIMIRPSALDRITMLDVAKFIQNIC